MRASKPITVTLGHQQKAVDERLSSGRYASASEVLRAALRSLEREEQALDMLMRAKIAEALADSRPDVPSDDVFARLRQRGGAR
ncbi:type II toxin-antitoxin system ParD family antitoxin [Mesorhizobium xinjiangense]|uniref:type II toxin-antitoxin system ParD family antitoxin n=1 Tax=Mesorhizobium xinjiangense TaxID=2678685 RepID=UPI0012EE10AD|nr:type II toxin-antitoxin system ParD family antitoxin [Mesorhizobium xinjiangense]